MFNYHIINNSIQHFYKRYFFSRSNRETGGISRYSFYGDRHNENVVDHSTDLGLHRIDPDAKEILSEGY